MDMNLGILILHSFNNWSWQPVPYLEEIRYMFTIDRFRPFDFFITQTGPIGSCKHSNFFLLFTQVNKMSRANTKSSHGRSFSANRTRSQQTTTENNNNIKYPEIRQRGFYSDILPQETAPTLGVGCTNSTVKR